MKHVMSHDLAPDMARQVAERAFDAYREKYGSYNPTLNWVSDTRAEASFDAKGIALKGTIDLKPKAIAFELDVPFILRLFQGRAIAIMERELKRWTEKARAGEVG